MRNKSLVALLVVGVVLLAVGLVAVGHYHGPHHVCSTSRPLLPQVCSRVKRRYIGGIVIAALGLIVLAVAATESRRR
jgi:hypothetical protein